MKTTFEEYGKFILVAIVVVSLIVLMFGVVKITDVMGDAVDVEASIATSKSEEVVGNIAERCKPSIELSDAVSAHIYLDDIFEPLASVYCCDADGDKIAANVISMMFIDYSNGSQTDVMGAYNGTDDEFNIGEAIGRPGMLAVTYKATDAHNLSTIKTITYVIDVARS